MSGSDDNSGVFSDEEGRQAAEEQAVGILPNGERFAVPETLSVMSALLTVRSWRSPATQLWIALGLFTCATLVFFLNGWIPKWVIVLQFIVWRLAYNVGLGLMLHTQSTRKAFTNFYVKTIETSKSLTSLLESSVVFENTSIDYKMKNFPKEFNAWMVYRFVVNIILANDLVSYFVLVLAYWEAPNSTFDIVAYIVGLGLIIFALWSKADAHRVIGDYAWYWGDFFFLLDKHLVFDGIFQMFPHPMYTVGYAFMYGFTLMAKSYTVFYLSLFGHLCQLAFLAFVENPHIDKTYNAYSEPTAEEKEREAILYDGYLEKRELVVFKNLDPFRSSDIILLVLVTYLLVANFLLDLPLAVHVMHYVGWRLFNNGGLGWALSEQSKHQRWTRKYSDDPRNAFDHWKRVYNTSVTMTNLTYFACGYQTFTWLTPVVSLNDARAVLFTIGALLLLINIYVSWGVYEAIGDFGYFYGDFFLDHVPTQLTYSGIYRYLNNPDSSLGLAGYYGVAMMSGSPTMLVLAVLSHACIKLFEVLVEQPHMKRKYGRQLRRQGGLRSEMKKKGAELKEVLQKKKEKYESTVANLTAQIDQQKKNFERYRARVEKQGKKQK